MTPLRVLPALAIATLLGAQSGGNLLMHYDGTTEATSRGVGLPTETTTVLQRYPWNQCCNRTRLCCVEMDLQDQDPSTPEFIHIEVRSSDLTDPSFPLGKPDMTNSGLLYLLPMPLYFGSSSVMHLALNLPCIPLPPGPGPAGDFYIGLRFTPTGSWPTDGLSCHFSGRFGTSPGEQFLTPPFPMYAAAPNAGLAWSWSPSAGTVIASGDRSWAISAGLFEDVCQP